jgi:hypothetical protein
MLYNKPTRREIMARKISSGDYTAAAMTRVMSWGSENHVQGLHQFPSTAHLTLNVLSFSAFAFFISRKFGTWASF